MFQNNIRNEKIVDVVLKIAETRVVFIMLITKTINKNIAYSLHNELNNACVI